MTDQIVLSRNLNLGVFWASALVCASQKIWGFYMSSSEIRGTRFAGRHACSAAVYSIESDQITAEGYLHMSVK